METTFHKASGSYRLFKQLLDNIDGENFIHSIAYKIKPQSSVIRELFEQNEDEEIKCS
ncbi:MAG: hypothetical protein U5Q03_17470 [Bacteroidota bacterium]|nr:hypothetical protein [Bacteroidota bacterium]